MEIPLANLLACLLNWLVPSQARREGGDCAVCSSDWLILQHPVVATAVRIGPLNSFAAVPVEDTVLLAEQLL